MTTNDERSTARMVTYRVQDGRAEENAAYVHEVMADLAARGADVDYAVYLLDDGVGFVHVVEERDGGAALRDSEAFRRLTSTIGGRCDEAPVLRELTLVGRHRR